MQINPTEPVAQEVPAPPPPSRIPSRKNSTRAIHDFDHFLRAASTIARENFKDAKLADALLKIAQKARESAR